MSVCLIVRPSIHPSALTGKIFIKFDISIFFEIFRENSILIEIYYVKTYAHLC